MKLTFITITLAAGVTLASAQPPEPFSPELLLTLPATGSPIAVGNNQTPVSSLNLTSYRIEEISLPTPIEVELDSGQLTTVSKAFRITVFGGPFDTVGDQPTAILIRNESAGVEAQLLATPWQPDPTQVPDRLVAILYDPFALVDHSTILISLGLDENDDQFALPDELLLLRNP